MTHVFFCPKCGAWFFTYTDLAYHQNGEAIKEGAANWKKGWSTS